MVTESERKWGKTLLRRENERPGFNHTENDDWRCINIFDRRLTGKKEDRWEFHHTSSAYTGKEIISIEVTLLLWHIYWGIGLLDMQCNG